jgi:hypothetical protein
MTDPLKNQRRLTNIIQALCEDALRGELGLERFWDSWPEEANSNGFFRQIYDDLEDGVEHLPGEWFTGKILWRAWLGSGTYLTIYLDGILLGYDRSSEELMQCREFLLKQKKLSEENIKSKVAEYFHTHQ